MVYQILNNIFMNEITNRILLFIEHPTAQIIKNYFEDLKFIQEYEKMIHDINDNNLLYSDNEYNYFNDNYDNLFEYI
jgi:hypothetical protein